MTTSIEQDNINISWILEKKKKSLEDREALLLLAHDVLYNREVKLEILEKRARRLFLALQRYQKQHKIKLTWIDFKSLEEE